MNDKTRKQLIEHLEDHEWEQTQKGLYMLERHKGISSERVFCDLRRIKPLFYAYQDDEKLSKERVERMTEVKEAQAIALSSGTASLNKFT